MRLYEDDLTSTLQVLRFLETLDIPEGFFPEFRLCSFMENAPDIQFHWDGAWFAYVGDGDPHE